MKRSYTNVKLFISFLFLSLIFSQNAFSQLAIIGDLKGNDYYGGFSVKNTSGTSHDYVYSSVEIRDDGWSGTKVWETIAGSYIASAEQKKGTTEILVLVQSGDPTLNGNVYLVNPAVPFGSNAVLIGQVTDGGSVTWEDIKGDAVYVRNNQHLFVSHDLGATWNIDSTGLIGATINNFCLDSASTVYLAASGGLFKQDTSVTTWTQMSSFAGYGTPQNVFEDREGRIYVSSTYGVYISTNAGVSWSIDSGGIGTAAVSKFSDDLYHNVYAIANNKLFKSAGGTASWVETDGGINAICIKTPTYTGITGDTVLVAATSFGAFRSTDQGATWALGDTGSYVDRLTSFVKTPTGRYVACDALGIFRKDFPDATWAKTYPVAGFHASLVLYGDAAGNLFIQNQDLNATGAIPLIKSTDNGNTWSVDTAGEAAIDGNVFYIDENNNQHYGTSYYGSSFYTHMWLRTPGGSWVADTNNFPVHNYSYVNSICSDQSGYLYASGYFNGYNSVLRRPVAGGAWALDTVGTTVYGNLPHMTSGHNTILAYNNTHLLMRKASGWAVVPFPAAIAADGIVSASVDGNGVIFANFKSMISDGVYYTADSGTSWVFAGLDHITAYTLVSYGDTTFACTDRDGGYKLTATPYITPLQTPVVTAITASHLQLSNQPNPFGNTTRINYSVPQDAMVTIKILDMTGREISQLVNEMQKAGSYSLSWNGKDLPHGNYTCTITATSPAGGYTEHRSVKMTHY